MNRFTLPKWIKELQSSTFNFDKLDNTTINKLKADLSKFNIDKADATIVIPAWNEQENLVRTLASLSKLNTNNKVELIVVNNNSTDATQEILNTLGVRSYFQPIQGISVTRQLGLEQAKGNIILSADADSLYPSNWGQSYIDILSKPENAIAYGRYSFIPSQGQSRIYHGIHETIAETLFLMRRRRKDCINVMGFNFAYRKDQALESGGFSRTKMKWEDGGISQRISDIYGRIVLESGVSSRVWTSDRRLMADGSLAKAFYNRFKKEIKYVHELWPFYNAPFPKYY